MGLLSESPAEPMKVASQREEPMIVCAKNSCAAKNASLCEVGIRLQKEGLMIIGLPKCSKN